MAAHQEKHGAFWGSSFSQGAFCLSSAEGVCGGGVANKSKLTVGKGPLTKPGIYVGKCIKAEKKRGGKVAVLLFESNEGLAHKWIPITEPFRFEYYEAVRLALDVKENPPLGTPIEPEDVFEGKTFEYSVTWRRDPGKPKSIYEGPKKPRLVKGFEKQDFLRVRQLTKLIAPF